MRVVIVGAGYAGLLCAFRLKRRAGSRCEVTVVDRSEHFVERVRLHEYVTGARAPLHALGPWLESKQIRWVRGALEGLDLSRSCVTVDGRALPFDRLVLALGSKASDRLPGSREWAYSFDRADALRDKLRSMGDGRVAVIGAGLTGLEAATEIRSAFSQVNVSLLHRGELAPMLSDEARRHVVKALDRMAIERHPDCHVLAIDARGVSTTRRRIDADVVVNCAGFEAPPLLSTLGLDTDSLGFLQVDRCLRSATDARVFAIGDAASIDGEPGLHKSCKTAMPMGAYAADAILASIEEKSIGEFDLRDTGVCVSLGRSDAVIQGYREGAAPNGTVITGRLAVWLKERGVRYTTWSLRAEADDRWSYRWLRRSRRPAAKLSASVAP